MDQMEEIYLHVPPYKEIDLFYPLIKQDPDFLHNFDTKRFVQTPLHFAAGEGRTQLALEIQRLMPSLGMKLNADGFSPLHLALKGGHFDTVRAMVRLNPELVAVQGREGMTPLHYAVEIDAVDLLADFLIWCPESIETLTVREETAAHVAVKSRKLAALRVLVGWVRRKGKQRVLAWKDLEGNAVLHLAASTNQPEVLKLLVRAVLYGDLNGRNCKGLTALDIVMQLPNHEDNTKALSILRRRGAKAGSSIPRVPILADYLSSSLIIMGRLGQYFDEDIPTEMRSAALVVAGLIVAATYQGVLKPPGIVARQTPIIANFTRFDNSSSSTNISSNTSSAWVGVDLLIAQQAQNLSRTELTERDAIFALGFMLPNCSALAASLGMILLLLPCRTYTFLLHLSLVFLTFSSYMTLAFTTWWQPEMKVSTDIGAVSLAIVFLGLFGIKLGFASKGSMMRRRLTVRDHQWTSTHA